MIGNTYQNLKTFLVCLSVFTATFWCTESVDAQAIVRVRVMEVEVTATHDCDGFLAGDSDFVWEYIATDNTIGRSNNSPVFGGILGDFNHAFDNNENGPYTISSPSGAFSPNNDALFFDHEYVCAADVPTTMNLEWRGYENDDPIFNYNLTGLFSDGETANQSPTMLVPATPGFNTQTFTAVSTDGGCPQTYRITFRVERAPLAVTVMEDDICDATLMTLGTSQTFAWCPDATLEPNEPHQGDMSSNRSRWVYFIAPPSGEVYVSTDENDTEFGTYIEVYHAADGAGCNAGTNAVTGAAIKDKFEYLSHVDFSDGTDLLGIDPESEITFDACDPIINSQKLHPGEAYYVQITTDDPERGFIEVLIEDEGGSSPPDPEDIPCTAPSVAINTTPISSGAGSAATINLEFGCAFDAGNDGGETGSPTTGNDPNNYHAYDYDQGASGNGTMNESVWFSFAAPNSGRMVFEADYNSGIYSENSAFFGYDPRFAPGTPADYSCADLTNIAGVEGGLNGLLGGAVESAIIEERCLEPGYDYFAMVDPANNLTPLNSQDIDAWVYDPSVDNPVFNAPGNDILCLTLGSSLYEVPVQLVNQPPIPFSSVAGTNELACIERLAGEPNSDAVAANRADQTVWHYFVAPPSGVVDMKIRAYIGMNTLNYSVFELLNGTDCYGGLNPATYTDDGTQATPQITPIAEGSTDFNGDVVGLCCLTPGNIYAIQIDGGSPGDEGQYIIEYINEIEVYAGDAQYSNEYGDTTTFDSNDTTFICHGDTLFPSIMTDISGQSTASIPACLDTGYVVHNIVPIPDTLFGSGFTYVDSTRFPSSFFVNDGTGAGSFGNISFNQVYYVSPLADLDTLWGDISCPSASIENGAPFVFLSPITTTQTYNSTTCVMGFSASGGQPAYDGSDFDYVVTNTAGDTVFMGSVGNGVVESLAIPAADIYTITIMDGSECGTVITINAMPCLDPCINNPVTITPNPIDSTVYTCLPGDSALVTIFLNGGDPTVGGGDYTVEITGSSIAGQNTTYTVPGTGGATSFSFTVGDGDTWQAIAYDVNFCRDTATHTFTYDLTNCPDFCTLNPIVATDVYDCQPNGFALINVVIGGGQPSIDGSDYLISTSGSTVFGQTYNNAQLPGTIGGASNFSLVVADGDTWEIIIMDNNMCADTITDTYVFGVTDCPNLCDLLPVTITPDPIDSTVYSCNGDGTATVTLTLNGGDPILNGTTYTVEVTGSTVGGANGTYTSSTGAFQFSVADGDAWQVISTDVNTCADTASGNFIFNNINCPDICNLLPLDAAFVDYDCNADGTATVTINISGGKPDYDGSNYLVTVTGSTVGGNATNDPVAGVVGGTVQYTFLVNDGDAWQVDVVDVEGCTDTETGAFIFGLSDCPDICTLLPIEIGYDGYFCYADGTADVTMYIIGGQPDYDGSNYAITVNGTSTGANALNLPIPGTIGDTTFYTFSVGDGDIWQVFVEDANDCNDNASGNFVWNASNCGNICSDPNYNAVSINNGGGFTYDCDGAGNAIVLLEITGGTPSLDNGATSYTALVSINGSTTTSTVPSNGNIGTLTVSVSNGDDWSVQVFDPIGCDTATLAAGIFNTVEAVATTDATGILLIGQTANVDGTQSTGNNLTYNWTPPTGLTDPTAVTTVSQPLETTVYTLDIVDDLGCADSDSVTVEVGRCVPQNAGFTPNNDGTNDVWTIPCLDLFANRVEVYNRWGQLVYQMDNYDGSWDGKSGNQHLPDATYYYVITVEYPNLTEPVLFKGTVTIIR